MTSTSKQIDIVAGDEPTKIIDHESNKERSIFSTLFSGGCAGAVAKTVIAPLDRTKILFQVTKTKFTYRKAFEILHKGYKKHGVQSWWRGNTATMARIIPYAAVQFASHEKLKSVLGATHHQALPPMRRFLAGSLAGVSAACCTYPLDLVRARMAIVPKDKYKSLVDAFMTTYTKEGLKAFYNGFIPTVIGIMPYAGISFFVYETLKNNYYHKYKNKELSTFRRLLYGATAGICGQSFTYPLDIVRRRMQTDNVDGKGYKYRKLGWTLKYILETEGVVRGFFKGMSINWIKGPIAVGISFATFDTVQYFMDVFSNLDAGSRQW